MSDMLLPKVFPATLRKEECTWTCPKIPLMPVSKAPWWHPALDEATAEPHPELDVTVEKIFKPPLEGWGISQEGKMNSIRINREIEEM